MMAKVKQLSKEDAKKATPTQVSPLPSPSLTFPTYIPQHPQYKSLTYNAYTIWLFARRDLASIVFPETAFGIFSALAGPLLTTNPHPRLFAVLARIPLVLAWNWLNVLLFGIANQRLPHSILEDSINKAWRPLPAGRLTEEDARRLLLFVIPVVFAASWVLGGMRETVALMVLTWMYNDLGAADEHFQLRNLINACGFMCYSAGATAVAAGYRSYALNSTAYTWIGMIGTVVLTSLSLQDLPDIEGDAARGRLTLPLLHGDVVARWAIAAPILLWSVLCPAFWGLGVAGWAVSLGFGGLVAFRLLLKRGVVEDKVSWKLWCLWTAVLYSLPLFKNGSVLAEGGLGLLRAVGV
jgi:4-hydroxybenzoate polyprenyltransferase